MRFSTRSWRTILQRLAPMDKRMANSRRRATERTEKEIGDIGAGEQQQHRGQGEQDGQGSVEINVGAEGGAPERIGGDEVVALMHGGIALHEALHEQVHFILGLQVIDAGTENAEYVEPDARSPGRVEPQIC